MKLKVALFLFVFFSIANCYGRLAAPKYLRHGLLAASACASPDVEVMSEHITLRPDREGKSALVNVVYNIICTHEGIQIPMLFLANEYGNSFRVVIDSQQLEVQNLPDTLRRIKGSFLDKFSASFNEGGRDQPDYMQCSYDLYGPDTAVAFNSFVYVKANLSKGAHIVQLQYTATSCIKRVGYSPEYSFRYSFSPANSWMRRGKVNITLDTSLCKIPLTTSLQEDVYGHPNQWELIGGNANCFNFS